MKPIGRTIRRYRNAVRSRLNRYFLLRLPGRIYQALPDSLKDIRSLIMRGGGGERGFFFIQIGSNDGVRRDPINDMIRKYGWSGILVEPIGPIFEKLKKNYRDVGGLVFEKVAIARERGTLEFHSLRAAEGRLPEWHDQVGSLLRETLLRYGNRIPNIEDHIVTETVPAITYDDLLRRHQVETVDLLHIDTEGYDYEIIRTIDFERDPPRMILYENVILSQGDRVECEELLRRAGYRLFPAGPDTLAYLPA